MKRASMFGFVHMDETFLNNNLNCLQSYAFVLQVDIYPCTSLNVILNEVGFTGLVFQKARHNISTFSKMKIIKKNLFTSF